MQPLHFYKITDIVIDFKLDTFRHISAFKKLDRWQRETNYEKLWNVYVLAANIVTKTENQPNWITCTFDDGHCMQIPI